MKSINGLLKLKHVYADWRNSTEELLATGDWNGSTDCGEITVREDFSQYAELPERIEYEDMLALERDFDGYEAIQTEWEWFTSDNTNGEYTDSQLAEMNESFSVEMREYARDGLWDQAAKDVADSIMNNMYEFREEETGEYSELEQAFDAACMLAAGHDESMKVSIYKLEDGSYDIGPVESRQTHLMSGPTIEIGDVCGWDPNYFDFGEDEQSMTLEEKANAAYDSNRNKWFSNFCERNEIVRL